MAPPAKVTHLFAGIAVSEFERMAAWYERLLGRPPDIVPHAREVMWSATAAGSIYVVADADHAGSALLTLAVADLDSLLLDLAKRGIDAGPVEKVGAGGRKATVVDPEGNRIAFAQISG